MEEKYEIVIGIDPGRTGGIAVVDRDFNHKTSCEMPDSPKEIAKLLLGFLHIKSWKNCIVYIEKAQVMASGEGKISMQNYMREYGRLLGMLDAMGIPYVEVSPMTWKSRFNLIPRRDPDAPKPVDKKAAVRERTERKKQGKIAAANIVKSLFDVNLYTENLRLKDGMTDAILIAVYGNEREVEHTISETEWQGKLAL